MSEFSQEQLFYIGLVAMVIVFLFNLVAKRTNREIGRKWLTGLLFGISLVLALVFVPPALPAFPAVGEDPAAFALGIVSFLVDLVAVLSVSVGIAVSVYNVLGKKVLEGIEDKLLGDQAVG
jgi:hypothetical protein